MKKQNEEELPTIPMVTPAAFPPHPDTRPAPTHSSFIHESLCAPLLSRCVNSSLGCVDSAARCIFHAFPSGFLLILTPTVRANERPFSSFLGNNTRRPCRLRQRRQQW